MEHLALYRQFRPMTFDEIVEQRHAVAALKQTVISKKIGHAYLFSGTRGTGKTSIAKVFSRAINCLSPVNGNPCNECEICKGVINGTIMDVIEMDAASNNSVDNIRRVCEEVMFLPSKAKYKVYIIDEVHMLSQGAFNALLKTLEEPPAHAVFLLATTEPHRIPATILSRCQRFDFRRISNDSMVMRLRTIADTMHFDITDDALRAIVHVSDGALRDAVSLLDQVSTTASGKITRDDILRITGVVDDAFLLSMAEALLEGRASDLLPMCNALIMDGRDCLRFTLDLAQYFRDLLVILVAPHPEILVTATSESLVKMKALASRTDSATLMFFVSRLSELVGELKWSPSVRTSFEITLLRLAARGNKIPPAPIAAANVTATTTTAPTASTVTEVMPIPNPPIAVLKQEEPSSIPATSGKSTDESTDGTSSHQASSTAHDESLMSPVVTSTQTIPEIPVTPTLSVPPMTPPIVDISDDLIPPPPYSDEDGMPEPAIDEMIPPPEEAPLTAAELSHMTPKTPNVYKAFETRSEDKSHVTNLSMAAKKPDVREAYLPLPTIDEEIIAPPPMNNLSKIMTEAPVDTTVATPAAPTNLNAITNPEKPIDTQALDASEIEALWERFIAMLGEEYFFDAMSFRNASLHILADVAYIVFPDVHAAYAEEASKNPALRTELEKIRNTLFPQATTTIRVLSESEYTLIKDGKGALTDALATAKKPAWVNALLQSDINISIQERENKEER
ncbi:MAG TPA: DNA polymerase III subunit gamma/tau [Bacillota bacterium]|nr:DNA polymerase III subunit gamma/tau [Bacillota bacterium]